MALLVVAAIVLGALLAEAVVGVMIAKRFAHRVQQPRCCVGFRCGYRAAWPHRELLVGRDPDWPRYWWATGVPEQQVELAEGDRRLR
jgi:hypothetical protein